MKVTTGDPYSIRIHGRSNYTGRNNRSNYAGRNNRSNYGFVALEKVIGKQKRSCCSRWTTGTNQRPYIEVEYPIVVSYTPDDYYKYWSYLYKTYNFTLASFWAPFLVKAEQDDPNAPSGTGIFGLHLDEPDESWSTKIDEFDYIILSAGHWFPRSLMYYENGHLIGCRLCGIQNMTEYPPSYGYQRAFRTVFKAILGRKNFKGVTYLRTFSPGHFEGGEWNKGGNCLRKKPFRSNEMTLDGGNLGMYTAQMKEVKVAQQEGWDRGLKFRVIDVTRAMLLRPDGHPSQYGHRREENVNRTNDCVHWCLPGPIDSWNEFLLEMLKEERITATGREAHVSE